MPVADARGIYHDAINDYVAREKAKGHNPYEHVPPLEAVAFLSRMRRLVAEEEGMGRDDILTQHGSTVLKGLDARIAAVETGQHMGNNPPWVTRAEMHAVSHLPGLIASASRCPTCGRFAAPDGGHVCPTTGATKSNKKGTIIPADTSGTWGEPVPASIPSRTFGIETEFTGVPIEVAQDETSWMVVEDESVTGGEWQGCDECDDGRVKCYHCGGWGCPVCDDSGYEDCPTCLGGSRSGITGGELVTPVLKGSEGLTEYRERIEKFRSATSAMVDESCGIHVHVGAEDFNASTMTRLLRLWRQHEGEVFSLVHEDRRGSYYCQDLPPEYETAIEREARHSSLTEAVKGLNRYKALNVQSFQRHGTVEYRLHHGSLNPGEVTEWAEFCVAFTEAASRDAAADDLKHAEGIDEVLNVLVRRDLLDRATAESLQARTGLLPAAGLSDPDVPVEAESVA